MLLRNKDFARRYLARAKELLAKDGLLGQQSVVEVWDSLYSTISLAIYDEAARWGDYRRDVHNWQDRTNTVYTVDKHYMAERNRLLTRYFPVRTATVLSQITQYVQPYIGTDGIDVVSGLPAMAHDYYNLQGQRVVHPAKGLYIRNGKKLILR
jgi:hypothetical protein